MILLVNDYHWPSNVRCGQTILFCYNFICIKCFEHWQQRAHWYLHFYDRLHIPSFLHYLHKKHLSHNNSLEINCLELDSTPYSSLCSEPQRWICQHLNWLPWRLGGWVSCTCPPFVRSKYTKQTHRAQELCDQPNNIIYTTNSNNVVVRICLSLG